MPRYRSRRYRYRKKRYRKRRYARRQPTKRRGVIPRRVARLERQMRQQYCYTQYNSGTNNFGGVYHDYACIPQIKPNTWAPLFSASALAQSQREATLVSQRTQYLAQIETGSQVVQCMVAMVSLRPKVAQDVLNQTQNMSNLFSHNSGSPPSYTYNGRFWSQMGTGIEEGPNLWYLNTSVFKIHWMDRFMLGDVPYTQPVALDAVPVTAISDANVRRSHKITEDIHLESALGTSVEPNDGLWSDLGEMEIQDSKRRYLLFFHNAQGDSVSFKFNNVFVVKTLVA